MPKTPILCRFALTALLVAVAASPAQAMDVTTASYANTSIGAEFASPYDNLFIDANSFNVTMTGAPIEVSLADYRFEVGPNCYTCSLTPSFDALIDITVDGITRQLDLPYSWSSSGPVDSLTFATPAPLLFTFADQGALTIAVDNLGTLSSSGDAVSGHLTATLTVSAVPEPAPWTLTLAGLGLVAFVKSRRKRRRT